MIVTFPSGPVLVDKEERISDVRLNIVPATKQMRLKFNILKPKLRKIDIVIFGITTPCLEKLSVVTTVSGREMITERDLHLKLKYNFMKKTWNISGSFGAVGINSEISHLSELISIVSKIW